MKLSEWIIKIANIKQQYEEGAITAREYYNAVIFYGMNVPEDNDD